MAGSGTSYVCLNVASSDTLHSDSGAMVARFSFTKTSVSVSSLDQELFSDFGELRNARAETDSEIERWAARITEEELGGVLEYTSMVQPGIQNGTR
jgi:hypothetical protein